MRTALYGRIVFGASAVLFGVIALMWHDPDTWQNLIRIWHLPLGTIAGGCLMSAQIVGGLGLMYAATVRTASIILAVVYAIFSLVCVAGVVAAPHVWAQYGSFFEQFSLLSGAVAAYAATVTDRARSITFARAARVGLGLCAVSFTVSQVVYFRLTAGLVPTWILPNQTFWAALTTVAFGLAAIAILLNVRARLAMRLMGLMIALFGLIVWVPLLVSHPEAHLNWSEFALNFLIAGAIWVVSQPSPALSS